MWLEAVPTPYTPHPRFWMQITDDTIERVAETAETALETLYLGNPVRAWLVALAIFLGTLALLVGMRWLVTRRLQQIAERTSTRVDDYLVALLRRTRYFFLLTVAGAALAWPASVRWVTAGGAALGWLVAGSGIPALVRAGTVGRRSGRSRR